MQNTFAWSDDNIKIKIPVVRFSAFYFQGKKVKFSGNKWLVNIIA